MQSVNALLDTLPRTRFGAASREVPAFRTCGVAGFHLAVAAALGGALLAGRSLPVVALLCLTAALSFFAYTYLRRWITGRETLVLLEHVWFAEICLAAVLAALGEPVLAYLDVIAPALALFLAGGRTGCLLAGCCHGRPSSLGIVYGEAAVRDGFPAHLAGVRLFPVQALEAAGLLFLAFTTLAALPFAAEGAAFAWFLAGYAVLRFGTEGLRGDRRPHWLGMSVPRWMSLAELGVAVWIGRGAGAWERDAAIVALLLAGLAGALLARRAFDRRPALLAAEHVEELGRIVAELTEGASRGNGNGTGPGARTTSHGVSAAVSPGDGALAPLHASFSLPEGMRDLELLCALVERARPDAARESGVSTTAGVLHVALGAEGGAWGPGALYGAVVRRMQAGTGQVPGDRATASAVGRRSTGYFGRSAASG
jgi:hypothetical protein